MKKLRYILTALMLAAAMLLLTGCVSDPKGEKDILSDMQDQLPSPYMEVDELTIDRRQTDKEEKEDTVYVTVNASAGEAEFELSYVLYYEYYDKGGWVLEGCSPSGDSWQTNGPDQERILRDIQNTDALHFSGMEITDYTVELEEGGNVLKPVIPVMVCCENDEVYCELSYNVFYELEENGWTLTDCLGHSTKVIPKKGVDPAAVCREVLSRDGQTLEYGSAEANFSEGIETHYLYEIKEFPYLTVTETYAAEYYFDPDTLEWRLKNDNIFPTQSYDWEITGTWNFTGEREQFSMETGETITYIADMTCVVTEESEGEFRFDYNLNPGFNDDEYKSGTVLLKAEDTESGSGRFDKNPKEKNTWCMNYLSDTIIEHYSYNFGFTVDAEEGIYIGQVTTWPTPKSRLMTRIS